MQHPHATPRLALVHNGIIENDRALRDELTAAGYGFVSETDTEAAAKLLDSIYRAVGDPIKALLGAAGRLRGAYALAVIFADRPHEIYAIRRDSPLIAAISPTGRYWPPTFRQFCPIPAAITVPTKVRWSVYVRMGLPSSVPTASTPTRAARSIGMWSRLSVADTITSCERSWARRQTGYSGHCPP